MILEGLVTTQDEQGRLNLAPMGPVVDEALTTFQFRPFKTSQTYRNLKVHPFGVFHVTDDARLIARAAINRVEEFPETVPAEKIAGSVLRSACRWYEFEVVEFDDASERTLLKTRILHAGRFRDFFGFNRARHAVVEAAILATRVHLIPAGEINRRFDDLRPLVEKTGGPAEAEAFRLLEDYIREFEVD